MISNVKNQKQKDELCSCAVVQLSGGVICPQMLNLHLPMKINQLL